MPTPACLESQNENFALLRYNKVAVFHKESCSGLPDGSNYVIFIKKEKKSALQMQFGSKVVDFKLLKNHLLVLTKDELTILSTDVINKFDDDELVNHEKMYW